MLHWSLIVPSRPIQRRPSMFSSPDPTLFPSIDRTTFLARSVKITARLQTLTARQLRRKGVPSLRPLIVNCPYCNGACNVCVMPTQFDELIQNEMFEFAQIAQELERKGSFENIGKRFVRWLLQGEVEVSSHREMLLEVAPKRGAIFRKLGLSRNTS